MVNDLLYQLKTSGYVVLPKALDREKTADMRRELDALLAEDERQWGKAQLLKLRQYGALRNLADAHPLFADLLVESPIHEFIEPSLGPNYILHSYDGLILFPGDSRFPWDFHTDVSPLNGTAFPADKTPGINSLFFLDDVTTINGAPWVVPASHRSLLRAPKPEDLAAFAVQATGSAGDALLFDARIWHSAGSNNSTDRRRVVKMLFCQPWYRPQMDYTRAVRASVQERLGIRGRLMLGHGTNPPASVEELRSALAPK